MHRNKQVQKQGGIDHVTQMDFGGFCSCEFDGLWWRRPICHDFVSGSNATPGRNSTWVITISATVAIEFGFTA